MRALLALLALAGLAAGGTALAQDDPDPYAVPEPDVRSADVLELASASGCRPSQLLRVRFSPPPGAVFGEFEVRVDDRIAVRLTGIPRAASATVRLPQGSSRVLVTGETLGGQRVRSARTYRVCEPPPPAPPLPEEPPLRLGGGED